MYIHAHTLKSIARRISCPLPARHWVDVYSSKRVSLGAVYAIAAVKDGCDKENFLARQREHF
jgi:hypothetical protein